MNGDNAATGPSQVSETPEEAYFLGVDGGGSKTLAILVDAEGREVGRGLAGGANYAALGLELAVHNIFQAVERAKHSAGLPLSLAPQSAWLGLAGVDRPADQKLLYPHLSPLAAQIHTTNDAELGLSALENAVGVVLIAGTGSIALGRDSKGTIFRAGGWGHLLGDEGSGYYLGQHALLAAVRAADGRGPKTLLLELILDHWRLRSAEDILERVYGSADKATIASLSPCVFHAAQTGDTVASAIMQRGAEELALAVSTISARLQLSELPLALMGGLLLHVERYRQELLQCLQRVHKLGQLVVVEEPALSAAQASIGLRKECV